jgi:hypothetical protein
MIILNEAVVRNLQEIQNGLVAALLDYRDLDDEYQSQKPLCLCQ